MNADNIYSLVQKYEYFIVQLFKSYRYDVQLPQTVSDSGYDMTVWHKEKLLLVEMKMTRSKFRPLVDNGLRQLNFALERKKADAGLLITTSIFDPNLLIEYQKEFGVSIWDRSSLFALTKDKISLRRLLEDLLNELKQSGDEDIYEGIDLNRTVKVSQLWLPHPSGQFKPVRLGSKLCKELHQIPIGKPGAIQFENKCIEILKYIFEKDLSTWTLQQTTDDTLHRFDLIARITSQNDFWRILSRDFKTRFAIFEFKNYSDPISQVQVYSTEKYLYTTALRSFAILICRNGVSKNAQYAMKGALKETGKLIIHLNMDDFCELLKMRDNGDDYNILLADKIDDMLMQLSR